MSEDDLTATGPIVIVGAGPGIGASVARRFGRAGHAVGLVARNGDRLEQMAAGLRADVGVDVTTAVADATQPDQVRAAVRAVSERIGEPRVLCFSPIPDIDLIRPVLRTTPEELMASLQLTVGGAAAAVESVLPGMQAQGAGSLLFTTGSAALAPHPDRAASAVTTTAATVYVALLREALSDTPIRVGHTVIVGPIGRGESGAHDPDEIAADLWAHHRGDARDFPSVLRLEG
ncbi:SDR family NAD(P)-dependent oxidoreductase [Aeromicrobium wangtongii]|uniref:SDR family NAD(P)-dependent oxidoreductase n=1 Tax=Aeromicrobium wangtongii TaxID=2969247 RepID=UPI002017BF1A|nr:SDR family NAD(P)-dependent oxidoreductase [Aeromicrobium wangtongii]MCL3820055.1 SDR family NAD(P)-dependent oxidoreductase [Aeromicrobium wangtongii]